MISLSRYQVKQIGAHDRTYWGQNFPTNIDDIFSVQFFQCLK